MAQIDKVPVNYGDDAVEVTGRWRTSSPRSAAIVAAAGAELAGYRAEGQRFLFCFDCEPAAARKLLEGAERDEVTLPPYPLLRAFRRFCGVAARHDRRQATARVNGRG